MSNNIRFIWDNLFFDSATLLASSELAGFPVENIQTDDPGEVYRTDSFTGAVTIDIDMTTSRDVNTLVIANHNLKTEATVTIKAYSDELRTALEFEEVFSAYNSLFGYGEDGYGEHGYGGIPTDEDLDLFPRLTKPFYLSETLNYKYYTVEISNSDTEFYIGRAFFSNYFSPEFNFVRGHKFTLVDNSIVTTTYAGNKITDEKEQHYQVSCELPYLSNPEAYGPMLKIINRYGKKRPFVIHFIPQKGEVQEPYSVMYGRLVSVPPITSSKLPSRSEISFVFEEEV